MGIESFFVIIMPKNVAHFKDEFGNNTYRGNSEVTYHDLKLIFDDIKDITYLNISDLSCHVMKKYLLNPYFENNKLMYIEFKACLWYLFFNNGEISNLLSIFYQKEFNIFHPGIGLLNNSMNNFLSDLKIFYNTKSESFISRYGKYFEKEEILPGSYFYDRIYKTNPGRQKNLFHWKSK
jgi:hypothetical protein